MKLSHGDVVLVPFPFSNLKAAKNRPALVLSLAEYNASSRDVILAAMTSNLGNAANSVLVQGRDMAEGKLVADSRVKVDKLVTVEKGVIRKRVGRLRPGPLIQVYKELLALLPDEARP
ncbi:MAG TPA: type II toxin-antitoxin system PemK/MazF family toxin [Candidatus Thermoplasmatota archaeon]|nr:type II toxin-antitoxin system PemK/MazF family toxin [Candidatus Thermoplasmatota archaeon]